ncbi:MAG TPA: flagellar protein FlaG [Acidobacteriota bacterium]|nr:flagellar protein FlaG [Acidobacteriota bacterium]HMZ78487.1 flagellar protein FlaG [Acidobacteriota bacterium]HNB71759.1 flagellar protein FlaG [Acidobacteriota bacterium]HND19346.1 flagellar protein FlaG [Acidobacteriota bacterium]HNG94081.1 flagellar protein FlaG [Acidobacteriota bacterium]
MYPEFATLPGLFRLEPSEKIHGTGLRNSQPAEPISAGQKTGIETDVPVPGIQKGPASAHQTITEITDALNISLRFRRDEATHQIVVELMDRNSGELIRQVPSETMLRLSTALSELQGPFINLAG